MTADAKKARKERVQRVAEHRRERTMTIWLSRDRGGDGVLSKHVDVWLVKPEFVPLLEGQIRVGGYYRLPGGRDCTTALVQSGAGPVRARFGTWPLAQALRECRVVPDDELQLIRVGEEPEPAIMAEQEAIS